MFDGWFLDGVYDGTSKTTRSLWMGTTDWTRTLLMSRLFDLSQLRTRFRAY